MGVVCDPAIEGDAPGHHLQRAWLQTDSTGAGWTEVGALQQPEATPGPSP